MKHEVLAIILVLISGCASYSGEHFNNVEIPLDGNAHVYIYSPNTGCIDFGQMNADIFVDGENLFTLSENSYALVKLRPGKHIFYSSTDDQMACHGLLLPGKFWPMIELDLEPNHTYFLRYNEKSRSCVSSCARHLEQRTTRVKAELEGLNEIRIPR